MFAPNSAALSASRSTQAFKSLVQLLQWTCLLYTSTLLGHGGIFKTPGVAQRYLAAAAGAPVTCMETAGEGGSYGMALLAAYRLHRADGETLAAYLNRCVFADAQSTTLSPDPAEQSGFAAFLTQYQTALKAERAAVK